MSSATPADMTEAEASSVPATGEAGGASGILLRVLGAMASSVALSLAVFGLAVASGAEMLVTTPVSPDPMRIGIGQVVISLVAPMLLGGALLWLVGRTRPLLVRWAAWLGLAAGVLTAGMPFSATSDLPTALALSAMHAIVGIVWFTALSVRVRREPRIFDVHSSERSGRSSA